MDLLEVVLLPEWKWKGAGYLFQNCVRSRSRHRCLGGVQWVFSVLRMQHHSNSTTVQVSLSNVFKLARPVGKVEPVFYGRLDRLLSC
uniref:Uncharacterized protein n=1 Tax=Rhizophora mucronata TaxID=61149 RepID=A0A2P2N2L9_RHIMU